MLLLLPNVNFCTKTATCFTHNNIIEIKCGTASSSTSGSCLAIFSLLLTALQQCSIKVKSGKQKNCWHGGGIFRSANDF
jgi:hypothetical protein